MAYMLGIAACTGLRGEHSKPAGPAIPLLDLNRATQSELMKLPGMTPVWAARIVRFRPYTAKNMLLERGVVPASIYIQIKDHIHAHRNGE